MCRYFESEVARSGQGSYPANVAVAVAVAENVAAAAVEIVAGAAAAEIDWVLAHTEPPSALGQMVFGASTVPGRTPIAKSLTN